MSRLAMMAAIGILSATLLVREFGALPQAVQPRPTATKTTDLAKTHDGLSDRAFVGGGRSARLTPEDEEHGARGEDGPAIYGSAEFRDAIREVLADLNEDGSDFIRSNIAMIRSIRELTRDDGDVLAFVYDETCEMSVHPRGWRTDRADRARIIAHESHHCWLTANGRRHESRNHIGFKQFERRVTREVYGSWAAWARF